jgi:hypothetical protein
MPNYSFPIRNTNDKYCKPDWKEVEPIVEGLRKKWDIYWEAIPDKTDNWHMSISRYTLAEIVVRIDKRAVYYSFYHKIKQIDERKITGLLVYWIVKLRPFSVIFTNKSLISSKEKKMAESINERFAAFLLYAIILHDNNHLGTKKLPLTEQPKYSYFEELVYTLRYRNLSIDAMMMLVETMTPNSFDRVFKP